MSGESPVKRRLELNPRKPVASMPASARLAAKRGSNTLILLDFDKTITDCDASGPPLLPSFSLMATTLPGTRPQGSRPVFVSGVAA